AARRKVLSSSLLTPRWPAPPAVEAATLLFEREARKAPARQNAVTLHLSDFKPEGLGTRFIHP
ncbi:MAG TPA: hypothetical protein VFD71_11835, partial [Planctomycetota bacterium]|nr:hypothetical protein [Planctomycetota bacterium]